MEALDEAFLHFDALLDLVAACDAIALAQLSQSCKFLKELCDEDRYWHKCFGPTLCIVPHSAKSWKQRYQHRKLHPGLDEALDACHPTEEHLNHEEAPTVKAPSVVILPPGQYKISTQYAHIMIEGYVPNQFDVVQPQSSAEPSAQSSDSEPTTTEESPKPKSHQATSVGVVLSIKSEISPLLSVYENGPSLLKNLEIVCKVYAVDIANGSLEMDNCIISNCQFAVILRSGSATVRNCQISNITKTAVWITADVTAEFENCTFSASDDIALYAEYHSNITVKKCQFINCHRAITVRDQCRALVEDCLVERISGISGISTWSEQSDEEASQIGARVGEIIIRNSVLTGCKIHAIRISGNKATISGCRIYRNSVGIDVGRSATAGHKFKTLVENCEIFDQEIDGIFASSRTTVELKGNKIYKNGRRGVCIAANTKRDISKDNCVFSNAHGDIVAEPFDQEAYDHEGSDKNPMQEQIDQCVAAGRCSYTVTGSHFEMQTWYQCRTCHYSENEGFCVGCRATCHKGHDVGPAAFSSFFCDCGAAGCRATKI